MSIAKIEQDIQLLEEKLEKINITISDPIERNEYKQQLQREIKKLNRTKDSLKQLQQEQQEIESLKYEVSLANEKDEETVVKEAFTVNNLSNITQDEDSLYDGVSVNNSGNDWNKESTTITSPTKLAEDLEEAAQTYAKVNSFKISRDYLSKRKIWISTVLAFFGFIFPYIYTRRWKPFCISIAVIVCGMFILEEGEALSIAPWISAIDNGVAINKSKSKLQQKSS